MKNNYNIGTILFSIATGLGFVYIIRRQQPPPKIYINLVYEILHYGVHCYSRAQIIKNKYRESLEKEFNDNYKDLVSPEFINSKIKEYIDII